MAQSSELISGLQRRETNNWALLLGKRISDIWLPSFPEALAEWISRYSSADDFERQTGFLVRGIPDMARVLPGIVQVLQEAAEKMIKPGRVYQRLTDQAQGMKWLDDSYWERLSRPENGTGWKETEVAQHARTDRRSVPPPFFLAKWILIQSVDRRAADSTDPVDQFLPASEDRWRIPYDDPGAPTDVLRLRDACQSWLASRHGIVQRDARIYVPTAVEWNLLANRIAPNERHCWCGTLGWEWTRTKLQLLKGPAQIVVGTLGGGICAVSHLDRTKPDKPAGPRFAIDFTEYPTDRFPYDLV